MKLANFIQNCKFIDAEVSVYFHQNLGFSKTKTESDAYLITN